MPELRKDPIVGRWVIISTERSKRPRDYDAGRQELKSGGFCPFCAGNEGATPPEVLAYRNQGSLPNTGGWRLRVVPNKFPALRIEGNLDREGEGIYDKMSGIGAHEVIIESPLHDKSMSDISIEEMENVMHAYRDRILDLKQDKRLRYILVFKNHGAAAGASLEHTHSQLIALPIIPKAVGEELKGTEDYFKLKERCIFCDMIRHDSKDGSRVVIENEHFLAVCPYAPRFPFETWVIPKRHYCHYEECNDQEYLSLAKIMSRLLKKLDTALNKPPFNFLLHTSPINTKEETTYFHWHFEIMPTLTKVAGFEWGSGFYINHTPPEEAAEYLRSIED